MSLPKFRFEVTGKTRENNTRGLEMRRVTLNALPSSAFISDDTLPENMTEPGPEGAITVLVSASFAKQFDIGDEFDLIPREV